LDQGGNQEAGGPRRESFLDRARAVLGRHPTARVASADHPLDPLAEAPESGPTTVLVLIDLANTAQPAPTPLELIFGLTKAEARLAIQFAGGKSPAEIAKQSGLSMGTVRSHLAAVFAKTQTKRQGELVALLARIAVLP
jgi:DNA-binding CsgD family transcriptional regulator